MNKALAANALADTMKAYRAFTDWHAWCEGLHAAKISAGVFEPAEFPVELSVRVERVYLAAIKKPKMPSKTRKHKMYSDAYRAASLAGLEVPPGSISTLDGVFRVMAQVAAKLATT